MSHKKDASCSLDGEGALTTVVELHHAGALVAPNENQEPQIIQDQEKKDQSRQIPWSADETPSRETPTRPGSLDTGSGSTITGCKID